ncbi:MAG: hypothetical protein GWN87_03630, partial [Desulfuromonadales bacterium]|nr:hypothetical protein [Desulfuromonadales bacterium]
TWKARDNGRRLGAEGRLDFRVFGFIGRLDTGVRHCFRKGRQLDGFVVEDLGKGRLGVCGQGRGCRDGRVMQWPIRTAAGDVDAARA